MCVCLSVFVLKCLCLSLVRRSVAAERHRLPFHPHPFPLSLSRPLSHIQAQSKKWEERARKETIRGREREHQRVRQDPVFLIQLSGSQGYFTPPPFLLHPLLSSLLCGCNQEGQIKGGGRVSLQRFSSQSCQSVAKSGALGGT